MLLTPGNLLSTFYLYKFVHSKDFIEMESYDISPFTYGLFQLA